MAYTRLMLVNFGVGKASLATVGYALYNADGTLNTARTTTGVTERPAASGLYGVNVTFPNSFDGEIRWDTGEGTPVYASESVHPRREGAWEDAAALTDVTSDATIRASLGGQLRGLFNRFFNDVRQTSSSHTIRNDSGTVVATMTISDDGTTATKGKSA